MTSIKLGFLGGGQLAYMAAPYAKKLGIEVHILDQAGCPADGAYAHFTPGSIQSESDIKKFATGMDFLTIEIENINVDALAVIEETSVVVRPSSKVIRLIQDKGTQKNFLSENTFPTSPYHLIKDRTDLDNYKEFLPAFQKLRTGGYDGKGVVSLRSENDLSKAFSAPSVLEKAVSMKHEISVVVARSESNDLVAFPPVEMIFNEELNLIDFLYCPITIEKSILDKATLLAKDVAQRLGIVGLLAIEMFVSQDGEILINELAPRTHNSGHHTIEATNISQFEQHLRAVTGMELIQPELICSALMMNLVGAEGHTGKAKLEGKDQLDQLENVYFHWYGKSETRPGRKMGHVTITNRSKEESIALANEIRGWLKVTT